MFFKNINQDKIFIGFEPGFDVGIGGDANDVPMRTNFDVIFDLIKGNIIKPISGKDVWSPLITQLPFIMVYNIRKNFQLLTLPPKPSMGNWAYDQGIIWHWMNLILISHHQKLGPYHQRA